MKTKTMWEPQVGDKCVWADIHCQGTHFMTVFLFNGTITKIGRGTINCMPDGGGSDRVVRCDAVFNDRNACRQWAVEELTRMKNEFMRVVNAEIKRLL